MTTHIRRAGEIVRGAKRRAQSLARGPRKPFADLAAELFRIHEVAPHRFADVAREVGVSRRRAFYYAKIDRVFSSLGIDENRLHTVGWTKLTVLADHIDATNRDQLLDLAEECTVRELSILMRDGVPVDGTRCVLLYFEPEAYQMFEQAVVASGGMKVGRGLVNKEAALIQIISAAMPLGTDQK